MAKLRKVRDELLGRAGASATGRAYAGDWESFISWCKAAGRAALPASAESVELYLVHEAQRGQRLYTLRRRLTGIRAAHRAAGAKPPGSAGALKLLRELARDGKGRPSPKRALTVDELGQMVRELDVRDPRGKRDRAILLLGFAAGLRRSELSGLDLADVRLDRRGVELTIRRSKTDQEGRGRTVAVWSAKQRALCPVLAVRAWIEARGRWAGPLFTRWRGETETRERLSGDSVNDIVQRAASDAGLDGSAFGAHSLRAGCVTAAVKAGAPLPAIMARTGHRSIATLSGYYRPATAWSAGDPLAGAL